MTCPTCASELSYRLFDASVHCVNCGKAVAIPSADPTPLARRRQSFGNGDAIDREFSHEWRSCRNGIRLVFWGTALMTLTLGTIVIMQFAPKPLRVGDDHARVLAVSLVAVFGLMLVGVLVHLVGNVLCCFAPAPYHKLAVRYLIAIGLMVAIVVVGISVVAGVRMAERQPDHRHGSEMPLVIVTIALLAGLAILYVVMLYFWTTFLQQVAQRFGATAIASQCRIYLVVQVVATAAQIVVPFVLPNDLGVPGADSVVAILYWISVVLAVWYLMIVGGLNGTLRRSLG